MKKNEIIEKIKAYNLALDDTYNKNNETFLLICDAVIINEITFRNVRNIHFVGNTMWIDKASIETEDVKNISIHFTSIKYDEEDIKINAKKKFEFYK